MANKKIFSGSKVSRAQRAIPATNTVNKAGGEAYDLGSEGALGQYAVTGCLNQTFYAGAEEQVDAILELANKCDSAFVAKVAVYAHETAHMKDVPALLLNVLANRGEEGLTLLRNVFDRVVTNTKMLRNFVQILRSGKVGRKSMGTSIRNLVRNHLEQRSEATLLYDSIGNDPSLADIVKMVHPKPSSKKREAFYAWLLGKELTGKRRYLPEEVKNFEKFKNGESSELPNVEFRMLTALKLTDEVWKQIARKATWNQLRMNLNTFQRHNVFDDASLVNELAEKLANKELVRKANAFPYQLLTTYQNVVGQVPQVLSNALQSAMEHATENVPEIKGNIAICVDTSGSMGSPVTGFRAGSSTKTRCVDVAAVFACALQRKNRNNACIIPFDTSVHPYTLNPFDSVMSNAQQLARFGGGETSCESALVHLNNQNWNGTAVIFVSDNESWCRTSAYYGYGTGLMDEWARLKSRPENKNAKLVCVDIQAGSTTQAPDSKDRLNVGGWSDACFNVIANFINNDERDFAQVIKESVEL